MDLEIGQIVDGYRITGVLGRGGMGVVYKAEDTALSRDVALKVINANLTADDQFIRRFQTEARTLAQVDSPFIVGVHALRETDFGWFIVMEYVEGGTVTDLLEDTEHGLSVEEAMPVIRQMLLAFVDAHGANVIHRDIKPDNVMLTRQGKVKIADFGLAKQSSPDTVATVTQGMMGTLYYMSPEQVRGLGEVDHRSDLWSLGVVMYEMLTGRRPFKSAYEAAVLNAILNDEPEPITEEDGDIPQGVRDVIFRLLEKDRGDRFQTAREVLDALDDLEQATAARIDSTDAPGETATAREDRPAHANSSVNSSYSASEKSGFKLKRWAQGFTLVLAVTAAVINFYGVISNRTDASTSSDYLSIMTSPSEADVTVDDRSAGRTPISDFEVSGTDGRAPVRIEKDGFRPIDTVLTLGVRHSLELRSVADGGGETLTEADTDTPQDDGGQTAPPDDGGESAPVDDPGGADTEPVSTPPARGTLSVTLTPDNSSLLVDGREATSGEALGLPPGDHEVLMTHPLHGEMTRVVSVRPGESTELTCFFTGRVQISTTPTWATVVLNDRETEHTTPTVLELGPGAHRVTVKKFGYDVEQTGGPTGNITFEGSCDGQESVQLTFALTEQ